MAKAPERSRHKWSALHTFLRCNMNPETQRVVVFVILLFLIIVNVVLMFLLAYGSILKWQSGIKVTLFI